jgi:formiminoglutamase
MNLRIFFDPIEPMLSPSEMADSGLFIHTVARYENNFPDLTKAEVAIIGLQESRGTLTNQGVEYAANAIRKKLYRLKRSNPLPVIVDLGNLRVGISLEESYMRLKEVCEYLIQKNIIPILIGSSNDMDYGQFLAYQSLDKLISLVTIDAKMDMLASTADMSQHHTHRILVHEPNYLFDYSHLAYQTFLTDQETINVLEKLYFESHRIGEVKELINEMEPVIRNADMVSFDVTSIRFAEAPGNIHAQPFGLSGEEACKLAWYAGLNNKLSSIGFYEYNPSLDPREQTASVVATMIWYFVEGVAHRVNEEDFNGTTFSRYIVSIQGDPHQLIFYKNKRSEKWWMEVPYPAYKNRKAENAIVPCSYNDYLNANKGELPMRWINAHAKLI